MSDTHRSKLRILFRAQMCTASTFPVDHLCLIKHKIIVSVPPRLYFMYRQSFAKTHLRLGRLQLPWKTKVVMFHITGLGRQTLHPPMKAQAEGSVQRLTCHHSPRSLQSHHVQHSLLHTHVHLHGSRMSTVDTIEHRFDYRRSFSPAFGGHQQ